MHPKDQRARSRTLSLWLRHDPGAGGLTLDARGWAEVDAVLAALERAGLPTPREGLVEVVEQNDKRRFTLSEDGRLIRANQGHSLEVDLGLRAATPPARLFHGTVEAALEAIFAEGLRRGERHHVHLSADLETARRVGARRGPPVILEVDAEAMAAAGHTFFLSENGVWLVEAAPPGFLRRVGVTEAERPPR